MAKVVSYVKIRTEMSHSPVLSLPEKLSVGLAPCFYPRKDQLLLNLEQVYLSQKSDVGNQWELMV